MTTPRNSSLEDLLRYHIEQRIPIPLQGSGFYELEFRLSGTAAATAANYNHIGIFPYASGRLVRGWYSYSNAGGAGALFVVNKIGSGVANDSGVSMSANCDMASAPDANTPRAITLLTGSAIDVAVGDRIGLEDAGTLTNLTDLIVHLQFQVFQF